MPNHPIVVSGAVIVVSVAVAVSFPSSAESMQEECTYTIKYQN